MPRSSPSISIADRPALRWRVRLLGDVALTDAQGDATRLPGRAVSALLARLALASERAHSREELIELLWPGVGLGVGRNRLRQTLSSLKSLLEPQDAPVLLADRLAVRVVPGALQCDVVAFEAALRAGQGDQARALYRGELMPGFFDDWIADERLRLAALADQLPASVAGPRLRAAAPSIGQAPAYLTRFFGRESDSAQLRAEVLHHRLVTLVGAGGTGKTRLAAELAAALSAAPRLQRAEPGMESPFAPLRFVHLVSCSGRAEVLQAIAAAVGCEAEADALERALQGHHALLVLDNFEHLVESTAGLLQSLLARLPWLHLLVTSRRVLGIDGERECVLGALPVPLPDASLAAAAASPAVGLFVDRARAARADFQLEPANLAAVVALVQALDAMPLALELAAARCRTLAPHQLLQMLSDAARGAAAEPALALLQRPGQRGDRDPRPATMAWVVQWSWQLLSAPAQSLLADLTVFRAGASAAAVPLVCGLAPMASALLLDTLRTHSLLQRQPADEGGERFGMLEVIREFAAARLGAARAAQLRERLRGWLIAWAQGLRSAALATSVAPELGNIQAAVQSGLDDGAPEQAMQLALALRDYWELDGMPPQMLQALEAALAAGTQWPAALRCDAHELLAYVGFGSGSASMAVAHSDAALALAGADPQRRGRCMLRQVWVRLASGNEMADPEARLADALALARQCADRPLEARVLTQQCIVARYQRRDLVHAEALAAQAQALWEALGNSRMALARLRSRAQCRAELGAHAEALATFRHCEAAARREGDWVGIIDSTLGAAGELSRLRRWSEALPLLRECVAVSWQRHHAHGLAYALWAIAHPLLRVGRTEDAVVMMGVAQGYWSAHFGPLLAEHQRSVRRLRRLAATRLDPQQLEALWQAGCALPISDAVARALRT